MPSFQGGSPSHIHAFHRNAARSMPCPTFEANRWLSSSRQQHRLSQPNGILSSANVNLDTFPLYSLEVQSAVLGDVLSRLQIPKQLLNTKTRKGNVMLVTVHNIGTSVDELDTTNQIKLTSQKRNCTWKGHFDCENPCPCQENLTWQDTNSKTHLRGQNSVPLTSLLAVANLKLRYAIGTFRLGSLVVLLQGFALPDLWWSHTSGTKNEDVLITSNHFAASSKQKHDRSTHSEETEPWGWNHNCLDGNVTLSWKAFLHFDRLSFYVPITSANFDRPL